MNQHGMNRPFLGFGLGLRTKHYETILQQKPPLDWLEIITENYLVPGGKPLFYLDRIREHYPMVMHGVSLSIGSADPLDKNYLKDVKQLADRIEPAWISDHLCWTGVKGINMHDLLPLPYTENTIQHVVSQIQQVQDFLQRQILIENVSSYLTYTHSEMPEWIFLSEVVKRADCFILLDVNNIYVSAFNHGYHPEEYINHIDGRRVYQIHLAGHSHCNDHIIDTHDDAIIQAVWDLYTFTIKRFGAISTMIERDDNIPELAELLKELDHARTIANAILQKEKEIA